MKSSDLMLDALHVPLLAMTSSAGVLVLACYFGVLWLALIAAMLVVFFTRSAWRRARWMARTTMQGHESMEEARTHSLPWMLGACFGLRLFAQPSECDAEQSLGASGAPSRVADGDGRGASSLGQRLPRVSTSQARGSGEHGRGDHRGPHNINEDVDGAAELEPVHGSLHRHGDFGEGRASEPPHAACSRITGEQHGAAHEGRILHEEHHHDDGSEHRTRDADVEDDGPEPNAEHGADDTRRTA